ncbi:MAG: asparagine--tRNA ligase [bacterium]|nr:asparagine--tRNA ligase [bacterium]MBU1916521.1 asparagine--tRNA ligase [bacterium]
MEHQSIKNIFTEKPLEKSVLIKGWLRTARHSKGLSFLEVNDGSCFSGLQVIADAKLENYEQEVTKLLTGSAVSVKGTVVESPGKGQSIEIQAAEIEVVGQAPADYPLQKKRHSFEFLRTIAHLRPRTNTIGAIFRVRNAASKAIHGFFQEKGFFYLHTPIITASDCEGAGEMFRVSCLDAKNPPLTKEGKVDYTKDFFGREAYLTVSGQLEAEIAAMALSNVYTFGPTFRAENSNTSRHLAEFWMVEPEMAFCDINGDMDLAEEFLKYVFKSCLKDCPDDFEFFNSRIDNTILETMAHIIEAPFERISYTDAVDILVKSGQKFEFPVTWGCDLQSEHERFLTELHFKKPVMVTDYPKTIKAFYMYLNDDDKTVRGLDVLVPKVGEIIGGAQREHRLDVLQKRFIECNLNEKDYWWYTDLRRYGSVPHAGFGLGFERIIQFMSGVGNIREAIPFPRVPGYADF